MKKRITLILAAAFAIVLAVCGSTAAFAAEGNETINWYFDGEIWEYTLIGEAKTDENVIPAETEDYELCYKFNAEESGYYLVTFSYNDFGWIGFPDLIKYNSPRDIAENIYIREDSVAEILYYIDEGINYLGADRCSNNKDISFRIDFIGSEITDLTFEKNAFKDYLINYDIIDSYIDGYEFIAWEDATISFDTGKQIEAEDCALPYNTSDGNITLGKNKITVSLFDFEKETDMTVCSVSNYVSKVDMTYLEHYLYAVEYYDGYSVPEICYEDVTVYFTDGTSKTVNFDYGYASIRFPNGRHYPLEYSYNIQSVGKVELVFYVAGEKAYAYECEIRPTDFFENFRLLYDNKIYFIKRANRRISLECSDYAWYTNSHEDYLRNLPTLIENCNQYAGEALYELICNDIGFFGYVTTGEVYSW